MKSNQTTGEYSNRLVLWGECLYFKNLGLLEFKEQDVKRKPQFYVSLYQFLGETENLPLSLLGPTTQQVTSRLIYRILFSDQDKWKCAITVVC